MAQLYAACRQNAELVVKHVQLANPLQNQLDGFFQAQEAAFMAGIQTEIDFTGDWKPDADELLVAHGLAETQILLEAVAQNAIALPVLDAADFGNEGIRALFTATGNGAQAKILIQSFSPQQFLSGKFAFLHDGNVFRRLVEPAFSLGAQLVAMVNADGDVRFKSFQMLRRVFDLSQFYQQATDVELQAFCAHASLAIGDLDAFVAGADEGIRKFVHSIAKEDVLGNHTVEDIAACAGAIHFPIAVNGGRIEVPQDRKGAKALFSFLLDKVYLGAMNQQLFITNSNRPLV
jgi:hypothetical protein